MLTVRSDDGDLNLELVFKHWLHCVMKIYFTHLACQSCEKNASTADWLDRADLVNVFASNSNKILLGFGWQKFCVIIANLHRIVRLGVFEHFSIQELPPETFIRAWFHVASLSLDSCMLDAGGSRPQDGIPGSLMHPSSTAGWAFCPLTPLGGRVRARAGLCVATPHQCSILNEARGSLADYNSPSSCLDSLTPAALCGRTAGPRAPCCGWRQPRATARLRVTSPWLRQSLRAAWRAAAVGNFSGPKRSSSTTRFWAATPRCPLSGGLLTTT